MSATLIVGTATITAMLDGFGRRGWIRPVRNPDDRTAKERNQLVALLEKVFDRVTQIAAEPMEPQAGKRNRPERLA